MMARAAGGAMRVERMTIDPRRVLREALKILIRYR
jgi:hypothetical protein